MAIVKMKRLRLFGMASDREELLRQLQHLGCVQVQEPAGLLSDPAWSAFTRVDDTALADTRARADGLKAALDLLKHYAPAKGGFLKPRPQVTERQLFDEETRRTALTAAERIRDQEARITAIRSELSKLAAQKAALAPWLELDMDLSLPSTREVSVTFGALSASADRQEVETALAAAAGLCQLQWAGRDREFQYVLVLCHRKAEEAAFELLKTYGYTPVSLRGWQGTARDNTDRLEAQMEALTQEQTACREAIVREAPHREALKLCLDRVDQDIQREEVKGRLLTSGATLFLEGWVPAERLGELEALLGRYAAAWEAVDPDPEAYGQVPIQLKNNAFTRPLNMVTEMYSLPAYGGLDPNPLMAPFFILFYGIMLADMGYGLLMMLASVYVLKKVRPRGGMWNFFALMGLCGISTFVMGAVTGGFFGDFLTQLTTVMGMAQPIVLPALFTPLDDTMMILVGAMCLGFVQIVTGMAISVIEKIKAGNLMDALWEEITWWVVFAGLGLMALGVTNLVLCAGLVLVLAGPLVTGKGLGKITGIFSSLYNHITGYFGDILSYSRLMALMLAGSVIAQVFNTLGAIPGNVILFLIISLAGNTLNFALNLLGCYVHDLRLQCLEFFKNFYVDGGRPFRPLDRTTKYYDVVN